MQPRSAVMMAAAIEKALSRSAVGMNARKAYRLPTAKSNAIPTHPTMSAHAGSDVSQTTMTDANGPIVARASF